MLSYFAYHNRMLEKENQQEILLSEPVSPKSIEAKQLNNTAVQFNSASEPTKIRMDANTVLNIDVVDKPIVAEEKIAAKLIKNVKATPKVTPFGTDTVDAIHKTSAYASKKNVAEGMMDIALLTANANQLRFLFTYNTESKTFYVSVGLIITSLVLQVAVGIALIFKVV